MSGLGRRSRIPRPYWNILTTNTTCCCTGPSFTALLLAARTSSEPMGTILMHLTWCSPSDREISGRGNGGKDEDLIELRIRDCELRMSVLVQSATAIEVLFFERLDGRSSSVKRILIAAVVVVVVLVGALALWARSVLTGDNVRAAIAAQVSEALGQPVTIGGIGASVFPRVTVHLTEVAIGQPARIQLRSLHVGTDVRALISRRIVHAAVRVDGARLEMPLPPLGTGASTGAASASAPPVEIVSIDEIVLRGVEVVRGGRTLSGDIELVPQGGGVVLRRIALNADDTSVTATGTLTSLSPMSGRVESKAGALDLDQLLAFLSEFAGAEPGSQTPNQPAASTAAGASPASGVGSIELVLTADKATAGGLTLGKVAATAHVTPAGITLDPMGFNLFGGRYEGTMRASADAEPRFSWKAKVSGMNMQDVMAFAGSPGTITGTLGGTLQLDGAGLDLEKALRAARGTARIDVTNGTIKGLALVRTVVTSLSGRGGMATSAASGVQASQGATRGDERFSRLGATLALAGGAINTSDFAMTSPDVDLTGTATLAVARMTADMKGRVQLSEKLSKEAGTDLYRYTQEGGRVTLPATISGPLDNLSVRVDVSAVASRAIKNKATQEIDRALKRNLPGGLGGLFPKKPKN